MSDRPPDEGLISTIKEVVSGTGPLTPARRANFEKWGEEVIRQDLASGGFRYVGGSPRVREAARLWLKEKEAAQEKQDASDRRWLKVSAVGAWGWLIKPVVFLVVVALAAYIWRLIVG